MTVLSKTEVDGAISAVAEVMGLAVDQGRQPDENIVGPFVTAQMGNDDPTVVVAVRDDMGDQSDAALEALAASVAGDQNGDLDAGLPAANLSELVGRFSSPTTIVALTDGDEVRALVVTKADRRDQTSEQATEPDFGSPAPTKPDAVVGGLEKLANVGLDVSVELGRTQATLAEVMAYDVGSVVELDRAAGSPVDVRVNGTLLAQGEVVLIDDEYAVRITAVVEPGSSI